MYEKGFIQGILEEVLVNDDLKGEPLILAAAQLFSLVKLLKVWFCMRYRKRHQTTDLMGKSACGRLWRAMALGPTSLSLPP